MVRVNSEEPTRAYGPSNHILLSETVRTLLQISHYSISPTSQTFATTVSDTYLFDCQDTMFYRWRGRPVNGSTCYIFAAVPPPSILSDPSTNPDNTKWYSLSGDASAVQIWNVTRPTSRATFDSMTYNTRPQRTQLLGTVNWTVDWSVWPDVEENAKGVELNMGKHGEGWQLRDPTPRFPCETFGGEIMVEIACVGTDGGEGEPCRLEFDQLFTDPMLGKSRCRD